MKTPQGIFVNQPKAQCSIYESGYMMYQALLNSTAFELDYFEITPENCNQIPVKDFYIFNYHYATMAWLNPRSLKALPGPIITFVLEMTPNNPFVYIAPDIFDAYCVLDPSMDIDNKKVYPFTRPLDKFTNIPTYTEKEIPVIGSFGFATPGKGFELVVEAVNREFERAKVRINIPSGTFADMGTFRLQQMNYVEYLTELCLDSAKPGIEVEITNHFFNKQELINWCSQNTLNCFMYNRNQPGLSATTDQCITAGRPLIVSNNETFRHIHQYIKPYPLQSLREAIDTSLPNVLKMKQDWTPENFAKGFENVLADLNLLPKTGSSFFNKQKKPAKENIVVVYNSSQSTIKETYIKCLVETICRNKDYNFLEFEFTSAYELQQYISNNNAKSALFVLEDDTKLPWFEEIKNLKVTKVAVCQKDSTSLLSYFDNIICTNISKQKASDKISYLDRVIYHNCNYRDLASHTYLGTAGCLADEESFAQIITKFQREFEIGIITVVIDEPVKTAETREQTQKLQERLNSLITKGNIRVYLIDDKLDKKSFMEFLSMNHLNIFLNRDNDSQEDNINELLDLALAVQRPLGVSNSKQFRHLTAKYEELILNNRSFKEMISYKIAPQVPLFLEYSEAKFATSLKVILDKILNSSVTKQATNEVEVKTIASPKITTTAKPGQKEYGIAIFQNIGDVLAATPIARQLKKDDPDCHITWFTSKKGEVAIRNNQFIDEIVVLAGEPKELDENINSLKELKNWERFFTPAAYMNYDAIPGGSVKAPAGTIFGIVKASAKLEWTVPFLFSFSLTEEEKEQAKKYWKTLPAEGLKILVETDFKSEQSPWTEEFNFDMLWSLKDLNPYFIFTAKEKPNFLDAFKKIHPNCTWCSLPYRLNAELFNLCDAFIGVSSGISCLTYSDYCRTDVPRIELTRGEHWGAAELGHHSELSLCYNRRKFNEALSNLKAKLNNTKYEPVFTPRQSKRESGVCLCCGANNKVKSNLDKFEYCMECKALFNTDPASVSIPNEITVRINQANKTVSLDEFMNTDYPEESITSLELVNDLNEVLNIQEFFEKASYVLKVGGEFITSAPNQEGYAAFNLGKEWVNYQPKKQYYQINGKYLREMLIQQGFHVSGYTSTTKQFEKLRLISHISASFSHLSLENQDKLIDKIDVLGFGERIIVTGKKRGSYKGRVRPATTDARIQTKQMQQTGMTTNI